MQPRVRVHFNLHTQRWSVTSKGRVIAQADRLALRDCTFHVSEATRQRVLRTKQRAVHAWVEGVLVRPRASTPAGALEFTYNPYRGGAFTRRGSSTPIWLAKNAWFIGTKAYVQEGQTK